MNTPIRPQGLASILLIAILAISCNQQSTGNQESEKIETALVYEVTEHKEPIEQPSPQIELIFALDATGSMSGLIHTAKDKIWSIASTMANAQPAPELKIGFVFYRDRGDNFITKKIPLTYDLDSAYSELLQIQASGGGDSPESVNQGLHEAVTSMDWDQDQQTMRTVFLVGDCPPHLDYQDDVPYDKTCAIARAGDIVINTIQLGNCRGTTPIWKEIAKMTNGEYLQLGLDAKDYDINTPYDKQIGDLADEIEETKYYYGTRSQQIESEKRSRKAKELNETSSDAIKTKRMMYNSSHSGKKNLYGKRELINDFENGTITFKDVEDKLPESLKNKSQEEVESFVKSQIAKRHDLMKKLAELRTKREEYIQQAIAKDSIENPFSDEVHKMIEKQSSKKGLSFKEGTKY